ncbi:hypothetical protein Csa_010713 [Cucumis sativus]|uniref:Uncharacterized protein n=1 Tax=Cucumis sativus TaxID=3659 RepID=A0A0A0L1J0_CUCSA|nr:hypothetical protein Csa_010713 [Cucumis sativus]
MEREPVWCLKRKVILAMLMLCKPSKLEVMEVPSDVPTRFEARSAPVVKGSWKAKMVPNGVVVWLTPGPTTPGTMK